MPAIGCPFCTKIGITMVIIGLAFTVMGITLTIPLFVLAGLVIILMAYFIPNLTTSNQCKQTSCHT